jgi:hypothetical protein
MRCIFCKRESTGSSSKEHVIPESLGNTKSVLPPGVVCDKCNNYFSREIERPFLESPALKQLRFHQAIPSKKGRVPPVNALLMPNFPITVYRHLKGPFIGSLLIEDPKAIQHLLNTERGALVFPSNNAIPPDQAVSRFLAKVAVEALAQRFMVLPEESQFDSIRRHAREGQPKEWPHHARRIYDVERVLVDDSGETVQTVYEYDFLYTPKNELYFVLALFGLELTINVGGPYIEGYLQWLRDNDDVSPLYFGRNADSARS